MAGGGERTVVTSPPWIYLRIQVTFKAKARLDATSARSLTLTALEQLHGQAGAGAAVDVLHVWPENIVLLRVCSSMMVKVQSALTLLSSFDGKKCHCHTLQSSHDLSALASTSMSNGFVQWLEEFK